MATRVRSPRSNDKQSAIGLVMKLSIPILGLVFLFMQLLMWTIHQSSPNDDVQKELLSEIHALRRSVASLQDAQRKSNEVVEKLLEDRKMSGAVQRRQTETHFQAEGRVEGVASHEEKPKEDFSPPKSVFHSAHQIKEASEQKHSHYADQRPSDSRHYIAFIHVGKAGGTSFDMLGTKIAKEKPGYKYHGHRHYDWTEIDTLRQRGIQVDVIILLRDPVARAASHFYFWQTMSWLKKHKMYTQTLSEYVLGGDKQNLLDTRDIWQDGQAGVSWLTGTHIGGWVVKKITPEMVEEREKLALDAEAMMKLSAARLRETKWFGLLEDQERSMILLKHAFNLTTTLALPAKNKNKKNSHAKITPEEHDALASLMPQDIWLYEYATRLFEARWDAYKTGVFVEPEEPPIPETLSCQSTRFELSCHSGPLAKFFPPVALDSQ